MSSIPLELIAEPGHLGGLIDRLRDEPVVGVDTEAASFHRFRDRIYLLQLSSPTITAIVDPIGTGGLEPIGSWLRSGRTEFVFHDADYDLRLLRLEYGFEITRLFDTRVAAQFLNEPSIGLGALLESRFGVKTDKRYQRADWSARPLGPEMLEYAATDTHYLLALRDAFREELTRIGRLVWVEEECELLTQVEWDPPEAPEAAFFRVKGSRHLDRRGLAILRELYVWRERVSTRLDRAAFRVISNETMIALAVRRPRTAAALEQIAGVGRETIARRGTELLEAMERGLALADSDLPAFPRHPRTRPDPTFDSKVERMKQWRKGLAERLALQPGLVAPNALLENIARRTPTSEAALLEVPGIRRWQVGEFGGEILDLLRESSS